MTATRGKKMLVADLFCGAGGSSTGARMALEDLGLAMELVCVNHWPTAIATHRANHPAARHYCQDIASVRPHLIVPEGRLDLLMASPTCTHHSVARGGKPTSDQQRADPWHVVTWLTELRVKRLLVENVPEFVNWGPVDARNARPVRSRRGEYFAAWVDTIRRLGFAVDWRVLNAADYGEATTRRRLFVQARSDGKPIVWPAPTHVKPQTGTLPFPGVKPWRPAREIIDWSIPGRSIFARKKPLSPKTLARIYAGAAKFGWPQPFLVILRNHMAAQGMDAPIPTVAANGNHIGLAQPVILSPNTSGAPRSPDDPLPTITTGGAGSEIRPGCARHMLAQPFVLSRQGGGAPRGLEEPTPTQVAKHSHALIAPYYGSGSGLTCGTAESPLPTVSTHDRLALITPITHADGSDRSRDPAVAPLPTLTTAHRGELAIITASAHYDILFRMLEPHELARAMGFDDYEFTGTKTEQTKQIGNAVPVRLVRALVGAAMADAAPKRTRRETKLRAAQ